MSLINNTLVSTDTDQQPSTTPPSRNAVPEFYEEVEISTKGSADSNLRSLSTGVVSSRDCIDLDQRPMDLNSKLYQDKNNNNTQVSCELLPVQVLNKKLQYVSPNQQIIQQKKVSEVQEVEILAELSQDKQSGVTSISPVNKIQFDKQNRVSLVLSKTNVPSKSSNNPNFSLNTRALSKTRFEVHDLLPNSMEDPLSEVHIIEAKIQEKSIPTECLRPNFMTKGLKDNNQEHDCHIDWLKLLEWQAVKKKYACKLCHERFEQEHDLRMHIEGHNNFNQKRATNESEDLDSDSVVEILPKDNVNNTKNNLVSENRPSLKDLVPSIANDRISDCDSVIEILPEENGSHIENSPTDENEPVLQNSASPSSLCQNSECNLVTEKNVNHTDNGFASKTQFSVQNLVPPTDLVTPALAYKIWDSDSVIEILPQNNADSTDDNLIHKTRGSSTEEIQGSHSTLSASNIRKNDSNLQNNLELSVNDSILQRYLASQAGLKVFICVHCDERITSKSHLRVHVKKHMPVEIISCSCPNCSAVGSNRIRDSKGRSLHLCDFSDCGKSFSQVSILKRHLDWHSSRKNYFCAHCDEKFQSKSLLAEHVQGHINSNLHRIENDDVDDQVSQEKDLIDEVNAENVAVSSTCAIRHTQQDLVSSSVNFERNRDEENFFCEYCGRFVRKDLLAEHVNEHMISLHDELKQNIDNSSQKRETSVEVSTDSIIENTSCEIQPGQDLLSPPLNSTVSECHPLTVKKTNNTGSSPNCETNHSPAGCGKVLSCSHTLKSKDDFICHLKTHAEGFFCAYCFERFISKSRLRYHVKRHMAKKLIDCQRLNSSAGENNTIKDSGRPLQLCRISHCGKFSYVKVVKSHLRLHKGKTKFQCAHCNEKFWRKDELAEHVQVHLNFKETEPKNDNFSSQVLKCYEETDTSAELSEDYITDSLNRKVQSTVEDLLSPSLDIEVSKFNSVKEALTQDSTDYSENSLDSITAYGSSTEHNRVSIRDLLTPVLPDMQSPLSESETPSACETGNFMQDLQKSIPSSEDLIKDILSLEDEKLKSLENTDFKKIEDHRGFLRYICSIPSCGKAYKRASQFKFHLDWHRGKYRFFCAHCNKGFVRKGSLCFHVRSHMPKDNKRRKRKLSNWSSSNDDLIEDLAVKPRETSLIPNCRRVFECKEHPKKQMQLHENRKIFVCPLCDLTFLSKDKLSEHVVVHVIDKQSQSDNRSFDGQISQNLSIIHEAEAISADCTADIWNYDTQPSTQDLIPSLLYNDISSCYSIIDKSPVVKTENIANSPTYMTSFSSFEQSHLAEDSFQIYKTEYFVQESISSSLNNQLHDEKYSTPNTSSTSEIQSCVENLVPLEESNKTGAVPSEETISKAESCNDEGGNKTKDFNVESQGAYKIFDCERVYSNPWHLKRHVERHSGKKIFFCIKCDKGYFSDGKEIVQCPSCSADGGNKTKDSTGNLQHACHMLNCNKVYSNNWHLKRHLEWHSNKKNYFCFHCNKGFVHKDVFLFHLNKAHFSDDNQIAQYPNCTNNETENSTDKTQHVCSSSERVFEPVANLSKNVDEHFTHEDLSDIKNEISQIPSIPTLQVSEKCEQNIRDAKVDKKLINFRRNREIPRLYSCYYQSCDKVFNSSAVLQKHLDEHIGQKNWLCIYCDKKFLYKYELKAHIKTHMTVSNDQVPDVCREEEIRTEESFQISECNPGIDVTSQDQSSIFDPVEMSIDDDNNILQLYPELTLLGNSSNQVSHIEDLLVLPSSKKNFVCQYCRKEFGCKFNMELHLKIHTLGHMKKRKCQCPNCNAEGGNETIGLDGKAQHICHYPDCGKVFCEISSLKTHITMGHLHNKKFFCRYCNKGFNYKSVAIKHVEKHTNSKMLQSLEPTECQCPNCSVEGGNKTKDSDGNPLHVCSITDCGRIFANPIVLAKHLDTHSSEEIIVCPYCPARFAHRDMFMAHVPMHSIESPSVLQSLLNDGEFQHVCPFPDCERVFSKAGPLKQHQRWHLKWNTGHKYFCPVCNWGFYTVDRLKVHYEVHTKSEHKGLETSNIDSQVSQELPNPEMKTSQEYKLTECQSQNRCAEDDKDTNEIIRSGDVCNILDRKRVYKEAGQLDRHAKGHKQIKPEMDSVDKPILQNDCSPMPETEALSAHPKPHDGDHNYIIPRFSQFHTSGCVTDSCSPECDESK